MAKIEINFDTKSIRNAINQVREIKKKMLTEIPDRFLTKCLEWVQDRANNVYLPSLNISSKVLGDIFAGWNIERVNESTKRLVNDSDNAVFIEFGVGVVGEQNPHPNAKDTNPNYEYNVDSGKKDKYNQWRFRVNENGSIDLVDGYYTKQGDLVTTTGSPANLYLYNAAMDLISTGGYEMLWKETLNEIL